MDFYGAGFNVGRYGEPRMQMEGFGCYGDEYDYRMGIEDGERRRRIAEEDYESEGRYI